MQLGMIGLGRMGGNIVRRLMRDGHTAVVYDRSKEAVDALAKDGATPADGLEAFVAALDKPRVAWVMLPAGAPTEEAVARLAELMDADDIIIDGGNSFYKDDIRRAATLKAKSLHYVDVGTSGGVWGLSRGYCMMIGGDAEAFERLDPIFRTLAPGFGDVARTHGRDGDPSRAELGYIHAGPSGAGHYVKMVHNAIEYGMMQAYAEGFNIMKAANKDELPTEQRFDLDLGEIAEVWRRGSVVASWLLDLTADALAVDPKLAAFSGVVQDSGEGRWTINAAVEQAVPANVLSAALYERFRSRETDDFGDKLLSAMRKGFGGHQEPK